MTSHRIYSGSGLTRDQIHGPIESMDAEEAFTRAVWSKVGKALPWIIATGLALATPFLWHVANFGFERINLW